MDFRAINKKLKEIDPTTPDQDLHNTSMLAEAAGIDMGVKQQLTESDAGKQGSKEHKDHIDAAFRDAEKAKDKKDKAKEKTNEASKPDFLDVDKDGDKKEPMKKAAKDAKKDGKKDDKKDGMSEKQKKYFGKKNESVEFEDDFGEKVAAKPVAKKITTETMSLSEMMKIVKESGGQQAIDPIDATLWAWAQRVAKSKVEESKQDTFAAVVYENNGGRFEMYDVVEKSLTESKKCDCDDHKDHKDCTDDCKC